MSWRDINTQEDIDNYFKATGYMLDSVILSVHYLTGHGRFTDVYGEERSTGSRLLMKIRNPVNGVIELLFTHVTYYCVNGKADLEDHRLEFRNVLLGRTNNRRALLFETSNLGDHDKVISAGMKWRSADEADEFDCLDEDYAPFCK